MPQLQHISRNNTNVIGHGNDVTVVLHETAIVNVSREKITLYTGGWFTATTKTRMNQVSNQLGLGYRVEQHKGLWRVFYNGSVKYFTDNYCVLHRPTAI